MGASRITEVEWLDAENFKTRNHWWVDSDLEYQRTGQESASQLHHEISNVRNGDLRRIIRDFPVDSPLYEQCAGWMHAVAGKHFFPDANHRTAIGTLRELLRHNDIYHVSFPPAALAAATRRSHVARRTIDPVELDTLYRRDALWLVWLLFFKSTARNPSR